MPERLIVVDQLRRNSLGKVDRARLRAIGERLDDVGRALKRMSPADLPSLE